jgi:hypothetical protein
MIQYRIKQNSCPIINFFLFDKLSLINNNGKAMPTQAMLDKGRARPKHLPIGYVQILKLMEHNLEERSERKVK